MKKLISLFLFVAFPSLAMISGCEPSTTATPPAHTNTPRITPTDTLGSTLTPTLTQTEDLPQDYFRQADFLPITACESLPVQHDQLVTLSGGRILLVTSWMPESLYEQNAVRVLDLARWADRSTCSRDPLTSNCSGLMSSGYNTSQEHAAWGWTDLVVVTSRLLLWFDVTSFRHLNDAGNALPNGGGGQLRGVWVLDVDEANLLTFNDIRNGNNWAPNMLLPGSDTAMQGSGLSGFISATSEDNGIAYNLENDPNAVLTVHAASYTLGAGTGILYSEGFTVEATGYFVDTRPQSDRYLVGDTGTQGYVRSVTTYQFAACDDHVYLESVWSNEANNPIGPVVNINWATNVYGEPNPTSDYQNGTLIDFEYTSPETCVVRTRYADTAECQTDRVDYTAFPGHEQAYDSRANLDVPPPSMITRGRDSSGGATPWTFGLHPLSGIVSLGVIFDVHSACLTPSDCRMISAFDVDIFNVVSWDSLDTRLTVPDWERLPQGIERVTVGEAYEYYITAHGELRARMLMQFGP
jgi:hypothetical protein